MGKVIVIGEALIDFIAYETGCSIACAAGFMKASGGAPANVAACVKKLGGHSQIITKLGKDPFGDFLEEAMKAAGIQCSSVMRTEEANTALAFVSLKENGERDFSFYRNPSADMLLRPEEIAEDWFSEGDILHFCSVDLVDMPVRKAHDAAIRIAKNRNMRISFDPNIRLPLWKEYEEYKRVVWQYIEKADILKISDDEMEFITGIKEEEAAIASLLQKAELLIYTKGSRGAEIHTKQFCIRHPGFPVNAVDTTGAGDSFIGSFLFQLLRQERGHILKKEEYEKMLTFSNAAAAVVTTRNGGMAAMPAYEEVISLIQRHA